MLYRFLFFYQIDILSNRNLCDYSKLLLHNMKFNILRPNQLVWQYYDTYNGTQLLYAL